MTWQQAVRCAPVALLLVLAGCGGEGPQVAPYSESPPVIVPGKPGDTAKTLPADQAASLGLTVPPSDADVRYVQRMIVHHGQALKMAGLAPERAANEQVRGLASRIHDSQGPEIKAMIAWLRNNGKPLPEGVDEHGGHGQTGHSQHSNMPGMATPEQLKALEAARGADFDRLFLQLMTAHHEGALSMASELLKSGTDVFVEEMANDVVAIQTDEIQRMRAMPGGR